MSLVRKEASWKDTEVPRDVFLLWADSPPSIKLPALAVSGRADPALPGSPTLSLGHEGATMGTPPTFCHLEQLQAQEPPSPLFSEHPHPPRRPAVPVKHLPVKTNTLPGLPSRGESSQRGDSV